MRIKNVQKVKDIVKIENTDVVKIKIVLDIQERIAIIMMYACSKHIV